MQCLQGELPQESFLYFADQKYSPYGTKSQSWIAKRSEFITRFLIARGCKALVVACNTATVNSITALREQFDVPIVGVEPAVKPAALNSKTGVVGVLATAQTLSAHSFTALKNRFLGQVKVVTQACPKLVGLVENVDLGSEDALRILEAYIEPLLLSGADHIVLGCTHFTFLQSSMEKVIRGRAHIIDAGAPVANELRRQLVKHRLLNRTGPIGKVSFFSSDASPWVAKSMSQLWGRPVSLLEAE